MKLKCLLLAIILVCSFMLSGCYLFLDEELGGVLDSEIEERIKTDYARRNSLNADKLEIVKYFGRCGENYIVLIRNLEVENPVVFNLSTIYFQDILCCGEKTSNENMIDIAVWSEEGPTSLISGVLKGIVSMDMLKYIKSETDKIYPYLTVDKKVSFQYKIARSDLKFEYQSPLTFRIDNVEELNSYIETYLHSFDESDLGEYAEYTSEFFESKSLMIACIPVWNCDEEKIEQCYISENSFVITYSQRNVGILRFQFKTGHDITLIAEVDKDDVQNVEDIYVIVK